MKLSTTLEQLLRLVVEPGEDALKDEDRPSEPAPAARVEPRPDPLPTAAPEAPVEADEEPWQARYTPPAPERPDGSAPAESWEARFTPEAPQQPSPVEPEPEPEPAAAVPEAAATDLEEHAETPAVVEHAPAGERGRLEQLEAAVSVAESLNLGLHLGLAVERIAMAATQGSDGVGALEEASWLIDRYVSLLQKRPIGADLHQSSARLARTGEAIQDMKDLASAFRPDPGPDDPGRIRRLSP